MSTATVTIESDRDDHVAAIHQHVAAYPKASEVLRHLEAVTVECEEYIAANAAQAARITLLTDERDRLARQLTSADVEIAGYRSQVAALQRQIELRQPGVGPAEQIVEPPALNVQPARTAVPVVDVLLCRTPGCNHPKRLHTGEGCMDTCPCYQFTRAVKR